MLRALINCIYQQLHVHMYTVIVCVTDDTFNMQQMRLHSRADRTCHIQNIMQQGRECCNKVTANWGQCEMMTMIIKKIMMKLKKLKQS